MKVRAFRLQKHKERSWLLEWCRFYFVFLFCFLTLILAIFLLKIVSWFVLISMILFSVLFSNFVEYSVHRWPMHVPIPFFKKLYKSHSGEHHRYFTFEYMHIETKQDILSASTHFRAVLALILGVILPVSIVFGLFFGINIGILFYACGMANFLIYEFTHLVAHLPSENNLLKIPYFKNAKERHKQHHQTKLMHSWNFNVSYPIFDKLFGTFYKKG